MGALAAGRERFERRDGVATRRLTVYLMREDVKKFKDALDSSKFAKAVPISKSTGVDAKFFYPASRSGRPSWVPFVETLTGDLDGIFSASASGLLLVLSSERIFAFTFGYGRALLDLSQIEFQFGLRVALNRIDARQIRSMDTKTFQDLVVATNTQVSRSAELPAFGIDVSTDILRAVTGVPRDPALGKRISGSDALVLGVDVTPHELPELCSKLLAAYQEKTYRADFDWIDHLSLVRDERQADELDQLLVDQLRSGNTDTAHLALPEAINWEDIDAFRIGGSRQHTYEDLDLDAYLEELGDRRSDITIERLKQRAVSVRFTRSGDKDAFDKRASLYQCVVSEQRIGDQLFALIEGRWFAVQASLVEQVDQFVESLSVSPVALIAAGLGEAEGDYNRRLAASDDRFLLLDAKIKRPGGAASGIELCDVLTADGQFIHVKRKSRSATLSHLFAQGTVSAATFLFDSDFRLKIREEIEATLDGPEASRWMALVPGVDAVPVRANYSVVYAIVANSRKSGMDWLPFFSKLNLMQHGRELTRLGVAVSVSRVDVLPA